MPFYMSNPTMCPTINTSRVSMARERGAETVPFLHCQNNFTRRQLSLSRLPSSRGRQTDQKKKGERIKGVRKICELNVDAGLWVRDSECIHILLSQLPVSVLHIWSSAGAKLWQLWASTDASCSCPALMVIDFVEQQNKLISITAAAFIDVRQCVRIGNNTHSYTHVATHFTHTKIGVGAKRSTMLPACMTSSKTGSKSNVQHTVGISSHVLMLQQGCTIT